jgi:hypothetical protein
MPFEKICQDAIASVSKSYEVGLSDGEITECSRQTVNVAFERTSLETDHVILLQKQPHQTAMVTHFKPLAAIKAIAAFVEGVASIELHHPEIAPFAVVHMVGSLMEVRNPLSNAEAELFYSVYCRSTIEEATIGDCREDFEQRWMRLQMTATPPFEVTLQRLVDMGLVEQTDDKLRLRQRVLLKTPTPIFE